MNTRRKIQKRVLGFLRFLALALFLFVAVFPLYWIFVTSLKSQSELYALPLVYWPKKICLDGYKKLFSYSHFGRYFLNSLKITLLASVGSMIIAIMGGFALSRYNHRKSKGIIELVLYFTQTIPSFMLMIPLFTIFSKMKLVNNHVALMFVYMSTMVAFSTIMSRSFFDKIPVSLEEAARIDGCNMFQSIVNVVLPITLPGIASIFCFSFINIWNELFVGVMLINSTSKFTIPIALNSFISKAGVSWDIMSAGIMVALAPTMVVFGIGQKYIVAGLTDGGVKG